MDLVLVGLGFNWSNKRFGDCLIRERLDRMLASTQWRIEYLKARVMKLDEHGLDHAPLLLESEPMLEKRVRWFKFQESWCSNEVVRKLITEAWNISEVGSLMFQLFKKLKSCRRALVEWRIKFKLENQLTKI